MRVYWFTATAVVATAWGLGLQTRVGERHVSTVECTWAVDVPYAPSRSGKPRLSRHINPIVSPWQEVRVITDP